MKLDLSSPVARAQDEATRAFAEVFQGTSAPPDLEGLPQVLVTGFGRFLEHPENATGRLVSQLVPSARYPTTLRGALSAVDLPSPQFSMGWTEAVCPSGRRVALCGMIFPVQWGLPPALLEKQLAVMDAELVLMNGIASSEQPLWIELGATNFAVARVDGSGISCPTADQALCEDGPATASCFGAFHAMLRAARDVLAASATRTLRAAHFQTFARPENRYLCNELTYAACRMLEAKRTSRVFLHWPSALSGADIEAAMRVVFAIIDAELGADPVDRMRGENVSAGDDGESAA